ncbi:histidine kinase OS=Streptomyces rimosus subsp. rimosus (strain ATCC / DSM 40260 / JCM 4667 / NRRL 2234) OX=1265868 GN=SRIM_013580 PE=4 SV=1 [Streptomyces rimosus subsp. rimosus]
MQGHRDLAVVADLILRELTPLVHAQYGAFFLAEDRPRATPHWARRRVRPSLRHTTPDTARRLGDVPGAPGRAQPTTILADGAPPDYIKTIPGLGDGEAGDPRRAPGASSRTRTSA